MENDKLNYGIIENTWLTRNKFTDFGWGNGYVAIPRGYKYWGVGYSDIDIDVHGGLTFSEKLGDAGGGIKDVFRGLNKETWIIGFDTAHFNDTLENCDRSYVEKEIKRLMEQLEELNKTKKGKTMEGKIQFKDGAQLVDFFKDCNIDITIEQFNFIKEKGYIKKSKLEIAKENYESYVSGGLDKLYRLLSLYKDELEKEIERLKIKK